MIARRNIPLSREDQEHIEYHRSYLYTVGMFDPQRAQVLQDLLDLTYQYDSIAAGDILVALDCQLHSLQVATI